MKTYKFSGTKNQHNFQLALTKLFNLATDAEDAGNNEKAAYYWRKRKELSDFLEETGCWGVGVHDLTGEQLAYARKVCSWVVECRMGACIAAGREDLLQYC